MARISKEELSGFNSVNGFRTCTICGKEHLTHGGCWCGGVGDIAICTDCADDILHLYLDIILDTDTEYLNTLDTEEKNLYILNPIITAIQKKF